MTPIRIAPVHPNGPPADIVTKMMRNTERRAGKKLVRNDIATKCTKRERFLDMLSASKGVSVVGKARNESEQYVQAALLRKWADHENNWGDGDVNVWNSNGVLNRLDREDFVRTHCAHFSADDGSSLRNRFAHFLSRVAHVFHGLCEMFSAPTGFSMNIVKNTMFAKVDDQSAKNRTFMAMILLPISAATTALLVFLVNAVVGKYGVVAWVYALATLSFPVLSSICAGISTLFAWSSQLVLERQTLSDVQKNQLLSGLNTNLERMVTLLLKVKGKTEITQMLGQAMQGKAHFPKFEGEEFWDRPKVPKILADALDSVDHGKTLEENMVSLQKILGEYLQVNKSPADDRTVFSRYTYGCNVTERESHYVALASVVDHIEVDNPHAEDLMDLRKKVEEKLAPWLHDKFLKCSAIPASAIDSLSTTHVAEKLNKWADPDFRKRQVDKLSDPNSAWRNHHKIEYIYKNKYQYGNVTRKLVMAGEFVRRINMDIVLSVNGQLSRIFGNLCFLLHRSIGISPPSRCISFSLGRFFGGALLALLVALANLAVVPTPTDPGVSLRVDVPGSKQDLIISPFNTATQMFVLAAITFAIQELVRVSVWITGWKGNISRSLPPMHERISW